MNLPNQGIKQEADQHISTFKEELFYKFQTFNQNFDWKIFILVMILIGFGLVMVFSSTMYLPVNGGPAQPLDFIFKQMVAVVVGLVLSVIIFVIPIKYFQQVHFLLMAMVLIILLLIYTRLFGQEAFGAQSWIYLFGLSFQPSELSKIFAILSMAWLLEYTDREVRLTREEFRNKPIPTLLLGSILMTLFLIIIQPDMGMFIILVLTLLIQNAVHKWDKEGNFFVYGGFVFLFALLLIFSNLFSSQLIHSGNHMLERIGIFVNPFEDPAGIGYQLVNGYAAISKGGWFGQGLGQGSMKYGQIPAIHNDFIIANIAEELGLLGVISLFVIFLLLFVLIFRRAVLMNNSFRSTVITGLGLVLAVQTAINLGGVFGIIPLTGVTLPFISSGGSSMIICITCVAFILKFIYQDNLEVSVKVGDKSWN